MLIRYFAAAQAAAGVAEEHLDITGCASLSQVTELLEAHRPDLAQVLPRCSFLLDEVAVRDLGTAPAGAVLDVLPPFAGG